MSNGGEVGIGYSRLALRDLHAAAHWWSQHNPGAVSQLRTELNAALLGAARASRSGVSAGAPFKQDIRRLFLPKVRYFVYFRFGENGDVWVVRVVHERRHRL